ncbi:MAG: YggS family pyridoxal phosphate-dependent enzyme [Ahniella sp.]|nr:YggS family pyridoxal phosphate-dependent enzyme [Ahniella sp.]
MDTEEKAARLADIKARMTRAAAGRPVRLLAVSKLKPASAIRELAAQGQTEFGENYVQEAQAKQAELADLPLTWHLIGPLQSNKCAAAAATFDWVQSVDREKIVPLLAQHRGNRPPLNVLIQVNIDDEASKSGCRPEAVSALAVSILRFPELRLRGLMAIPAPGDANTLGSAFRRMAGLFDSLRAQHASVDTLSMGMSDDFELAIAEGASLIRVGSALFGARISP